MTPDEHQALGRLETRVEYIEAKVKEIAEQQKALVETSAMGRGALKAVLIVGGAVAAVVAAAAWVGQKLQPFN